MRGVTMQPRATFAFALAAMICGSRPANAAEETAPRRGVAERTLWVGARGGVFVPYGGLYAERSLVTTSFRDVAVGGPSVELDVGARWARKWVAYGFAQLVLLGQGSPSALSASHGEPTGVTTKAAGLALRWTSSPDGWSPIVELGLGYRWLVATWQDGTSLRLGGFGDAHFGVGANWRLGSQVALSPMLSFSAGSFGSRSLADEPVGTLGSSYTAIAFDVGGHFDLLGSSP
jgi:hypothetical protein